MSWALLFSVATDTAAAAADPPKLHTELAALSLGEVFEAVEVDGDALRCWFAAELDSGDQATVTTAVGSHDGQPAAPDATILIGGDRKKYRLTNVVAGAGVWVEV